MVLGDQKLMSKLIEAWLAAQHFDVESSDYDDVSWAVDELFDLAHDDPDKLLSTIVDILEVDSSQRTLGAIGAGALEDLLVHNGDRCIDRIVDLSKSNANFKACLSFTFVDRDDVSKDAYEKLQACKGN
jgi:hypothetical protein